MIPFLDGLKETGTELVINEFIPFITDWCGSKECHSAPGDDPDLRNSAITMNRKTTSWNAAGAYFAYAFGTLAERQYKYVGVDQLIGGPWCAVLSCTMSSSGRLAGSRVCVDLFLELLSYIVFSNRD